MATGTLLARHVFARLPPRVRDRQIEHLATSLCDAVPIEELGLAGFEYSLRGEATGFDLFLRFSRKSGRAERFLGRIVELGLAENEPAWNRALAFLTAWHDDAGAFCDFDHVWLEFDLRAASGTAPGPSLFWHARNDRPTTPLPMTAPDVFDTIGGSVDEMRAWRAGAQRLSSFSTPELATVAAGLMLSRVPVTFRACLLSLRPQTDQRLARILDDVFQGNPPMVLGEVLGLAAPLRIDLDAGPQFAPRIGVEWFIDRSRRGGAQEVARVIDTLSARGWIDPSRAGGLTSFIGVDRAPADLAEPWPLSWQLLDRLRGRRSTGLGRIVHHVKFTIDPAGLVDVKVYLGATPLGMP
ncbi:MAG: hypothetical protein AAGF45_00040 [Pseudomonadota bacterium]